MRIKRKQKRESNLICTKCLRDSSTVASRSSLTKRGRRRPRIERSKRDSSSGYMYVYVRFALRIRFEPRRHSSLLITTKKGKKDLRIKSNLL